jgi:hypothetical protein
VSESTARPLTLSRGILVPALGVAIGVLTVLGQRTLPGNWLTVANSGVVWLVPAFFVGSFMPTDRAAAAAGIVTLVGAVAGYYAAARLIVQAAANTRSVTIWVAVALVGGPIFGMAGHWWRSDRPARRIVAVALLGGVFFAEGLDRVLRNFHQGAAGWTMMAVGIVVPLLLGRENTERLWGLAAEVPVIVAALAAYQIINSSFLW